MHERKQGDYHYHSMTEDIDTDIIVSTSDSDPRQTSTDIWDQNQMKNTLIYGVSSLKVLDLLLNIWKL